jgi:hypothetical protein
MSRRHDRRERQAARVRAMSVGDWVGGLSFALGVAVLAVLTNVLEVSEAMILLGLILLSLGCERFRPRRQERDDAPPRRG